MIRRLPIDAEISQPFELIARADFSGSETGFDTARDETLQGTGIDVSEPIGACRYIIGVLHREKMIVEPDFSSDGMRCGYPMDGRFDFALALRRAAFGFRVVGAAQLARRAGVGVFDDFVALDDVGVTQTDL